MLTVHQVTNPFTGTSEKLGNLFLVHTDYSNLLEMVADHNGDDASQYEVVEAKADKIIIDKCCDYTTEIGGYETDVPDQIEIQIKASDFHQ